jgi:hypothetical protein
MFFDVVRRVSNEIGKRRMHPSLRRYIAHNRRVFHVDQRAGLGKPVVLFELNEMPSAHIAYAYLAHELAHAQGAQVKAYAQREHANLWQRLAFRAKAAMGWAHFGAYKSFGVNEFIEIRLDANQRQRARELHVEVLGRIHSKRDIEDLHVNGVWIGDLVYDTFLMTYRKPTIDLASVVFRKFLLKSIELYIFWDDYLTLNDVRGINVSHCVYNLAMPLRLAVHRDIAVFQTNVTHVYRMNRKDLFAYNDFFHFPARFATLPADIREVGLKVAEARIQRRFAGEVGVDMHYSTKSAYGTARHDKLLRRSTKTKILVATHCFFDSPHSYGKNTFPDFYEWLEFLGEMSERTDYDWYIKTHPDYLPGTKEIIDAFVARYPKFSLLPSDASHMQIIAEGINVALTSIGTIGFEYAALGVPVINASMNNPHIAYEFNLHARDVEHYRELLENLDTLEFSIDRLQVYEYYFMRNIYNTENLFFENYDLAIGEIGGYSVQFTPVIYEKWLSEWSSKRHAEIVKGLHDFVCSGEFRMDYTYYNREFSVASLGVKE